MRKLILVLSVLLSTAVYAQKFTVDGINYSVKNEYEKTVRIEKTTNYSGLLTIPATVEYNGESYNVVEMVVEAFKECSITNVLFDEPSNITTIADFAFIECKSLKSIEFPESTTYIGNGSLAYCSSLETIAYGSKVRSIGNDMYIGMTNLKSVICPNPVPPTVGTRASYVPSSATLYVPDESIEKYKSASVWKNCPTIKPLSESEFSGTYFKLNGMFYKRIDSNNKTVSLIIHLGSCAKVRGCANQISGSSGIGRTASPLLL